MPVIRIQALPQSPDIDVGEIMGRIGAKVAAIVERPPHAVWTLWETIEPGRFVEGDVPAHRQPKTSHPPVATVTLLEGRSQDKIERVLTTIAEELTQGLGLEPGNAFVSYIEVAKGQVFTGGSIRR